MKPGDKTTIAGIPVTIATDEECEAAAVVLCSEVSYFPDDVHTTCDGCGGAIVHRPYVPKTPPKLCTTCGVAWLRNQHGGQA